MASRAFLDTNVFGYSVWTLITAGSQGSDRAGAREHFPVRSGHPVVDRRDGSAAASGNTVTRSIPIQEVAEGTGPEIDREPATRRVPDHRGSEVI
jgi:hypothetical protein